MSLLAAPVLPLPIPLAPHTRVQHIFYTAPYIKAVFRGFLEEHPENRILESALMIKALSTIYVEGLKRSPDFWASEDAEAQADAENIAVRVELTRKTRGKYKGRHQWDYFRKEVRDQTGIRLASRRMRHPIGFSRSVPEALVQSAVAVLVLKLQEAPERARPLPPVPPRPKRIVGRISRHKKTEP